MSEEQIVDLLSMELRQIQYKRFHWAHSISQLMAGDLRETGANFQSWMRRARALQAGMSGPSREALQALIEEQQDYDPAIFNVTIPTDDHTMWFRVHGLHGEGAAAAAPRRSAGLGQDEIADESSQLLPLAPLHESVGVDANIDRFLTLSEAASQKLWISRTGAGCICVQCPCPYTIAPSVDTRASHQPVPRHFHVDPLAEDHAQEHFWEVHGEDFVSVGHMLRTHGKIVTLDDSGGKPLEDMATVAAHNRAVRDWHNLLSALPWSDLTSSAEDADLPTSKTVLASAIPDRAQVFKWPQLQQQEWVLFCTVPDCGESVRLETRTGRLSNTLLHFRQHGLHLSTINQALQLFGCRVIEDQPAKVGSHTAETDDSHLSVAQRPRRVQKTTSTESMEIIDTRIYYALSKAPRVFYLVRTPQDRRGSWTSRGALWMQGAEVVYNEHEKKHPLGKMLTASGLERLTQLDSLRQQCRDLELQTTANFNSDMLMAMIREAEEAKATAKPPRGRPRKTRAGSLVSGVEAGAVPKRPRGRPSNSM